MATPQQYYSNPTLYGNYQFVSLKDILDAMEIDALDDDSFLKNTKRYKMLYHARQAIKEINKQAANQILSFQMIVPNNLTFVLPQDYVNYVRVSRFVFDTSTGTKRLEVLDINDNINTANVYTQNSNNQITFDVNGNIITSNGNNAYANPYSTYGFVNLNIDPSKLSRNGEFKIDEQRGLILFSSELMGQEVVVEYISDGLQGDLIDEDIRVHKHIEQPIKDWIYFACVERKRNVPANEKERALQRYKTVLHQAKLDRMDFNYVEVSRLLRSSTNNIKYGGNGYSNSSSVSNSNNSTPPVLLRKHNNKFNSKFA